MEGQIQYFFKAIAGQGKAVTSAPAENFVSM